MAFSDEREFLQERAGAGRANSVREKPGVRRAAEEISGQSG